MQYYILKWLPKDTNRVDLPSSETSILFQSIEAAVKYLNDEKLTERNPGYNISVEPINKEMYAFQKEI